MGWEIGKYQDRLESLNAHKRMNAPQRETSADIKRRESLFFSMEPSELTQPRAFKHSIQFRSFSGSSANCKDLSH